MRLAATPPAPLLCRASAHPPLQFVYVIRKRIKLSAEKALFVFVNGVLPPTAALLSTIYDEHADPDGFLYVTFSGENTFGGERC